VVLLRSTEYPVVDVIAAVLRRQLWEDARAAKELLSRNATAMVHVPILEAETHVTREEFERQARPWLDRTVRLTAETLAHSRIARERVTGVFLVGGSSRIPLVPTLLHRKLGIAPTVIEQPELVAAQGRSMPCRARRRRRPRSCCRRRGAPSRR
jgi:molecular chaperone DnaK (HSP70)